MPKTTPLPPETGPNSNKETTPVIFLGFNDYKESDNLNTFSSYFVPIKNELNAKEIRFPMNITYEDDKNGVTYKETEAICTLQESNTESKAQYKCEVHEDTKNIKQVEVDPVFNFTSQNYVDVVGISPFARQFMNNLQFLNKGYESISDSYVYIMDNSTLHSNDDYSFDIYGLINGFQPRFNNKNISLLINPHSDDKPEIEVQCFFRKVSGNNYSLHCEADESLDGYLQSATSFIDNGDILLVNFDDSTESDINNKNKRNNNDNDSDNNKNNNENDNSNKNINNKSCTQNCPSCSKKLKPWQIGLLIGIPLLALLACCPFLCCLLCKKRKRRNRKAIEEVESTVKDLKEMKWGYFFLGCFFVYNNKIINLALI